jgi:hypothetical protein
MSLSPNTNNPFQGTPLAFHCDTGLARMASLNLDFFRMRLPVKEAISFASGAFGMFSSHPNADRIAEFTPPLRVVLKSIDDGLASLNDFSIDGLSKFEASIALKYARAGLTKMMMGQLSEEDTALMQMEVAYN